MARPKKEIDEAVVARLAKYQCTNVEIAQMVECSTDTLERRYAGILTRWRAKGKTRLRARQYRRAMKGSDSMLIHLGKQYLGQTDKTQIDLPDVLPDPIEVYARDPGLMQRGLQFERDLANASASLPVDPGPPGVSGVAVPRPPPAVGGNGNGHAHPPGHQPPDHPDSG